MKVYFMGGRFREAGGDLRDAQWARTPFGVLAQLKGAIEPRLDLDTQDLILEEEITTIDLEGLDRASVIFIVTEIMKRGYLDRFKGAHREDSILYNLVNEALKELDKARALLREDG
jgi:hypothetical protein